MKTVSSVIFLLFLLNMMPSAAQQVDSQGQIFPRQQKFDPSRDAKKDILDAINVAKKFNKRIFLDVGGEWCIWCHRLDSLFLRNKVLEDFLYKHYVVVKINKSKENENKEVLSQYPKVAGYPHIFILDKNGTCVHSQDTGLLEFPENYPIKGHDPKKVLAFLKKWASEGKNQWRKEK